MNLLAFISEASFYNFLYVWIGLALLIFPINLFITAPYGRHTKQNWGPMISNRWGWVVMELPALLSYPILFYLGTSQKSIVAWVFVIFWLVHYINRTLIFPFRQRTKGKQMPLLIAVMGICFNFGNGFSLGWFQGNLGSYELDWLFDFRFYLGVSLFLGGMYINWQSDHILLNLRRPGESGYKIPEGGLFNYISCPNHLGEIIEWIGFAMMTWSLAGLSFAIWTAANLIPRALSHHKWYQEHFENYPKSRKAVIPGVL